MALALASLILVALLPRALDAQEIRGSAFLETRLFPSSPAFPDQRDATISPSVGLEPEFIWESDAGSIQFRVTPFLRWDAHDDDRTHVDLREATVLYLANGRTLFAGAGKVFWGKTEAHHLVDIINQTDGVEDIDTEDKLGQPMINFTLERDWGAIDFFVLPYFRERTHPDDRARLRGAFPVLDNAVYDSGAGRWHPDFAVRWSSFTGSLDLAVSAFRGTSREPLLVPVTTQDGLALQPVYEIIDQVSIDAHPVVLHLGDNPSRRGPALRLVAETLVADQRLAARPLSSAALLRRPLEAAGQLWDSPFWCDSRSVAVVSRFARLPR